VDQEDHRYLDLEVDALQLEAQVVDVLQQVAQEVVVHQLEDQAVDVLQQVVREADVLQLAAQEVAVEVLQQVELGVTCASVWMRKC